MFQIVAGGVLESLLSPGAAASVFFQIESREGGVFQGIAHLRGFWGSWIPQPCSNFWVWIVIP